MKKVLLIVLMFVMSLVLISCSNDGNKEQNSQADSQQNSSVVSTPTDLEVEADYKEANKVYQWFYLRPISNVGADGESINVNGLKYRKVKSDEIKTYAELESKVKSLFSKEIAEKLLLGEETTIVYKDIDGELYGAEVNSGRGEDITLGGETYKVTERSDKKIILTVTVERLKDDYKTVESHEDHKFQYENIDGNWVFTSFNTFR